MPFMSLYMRLATCLLIVSSRMEPLTVGSDSTFNVTKFTFSILNSCSMFQYFNTCLKRTIALFHIDAFNCS